ncbi:MAG: single-stranded-DNA-specific exonuclease RecJ [Desulfotomaculum sp.]|nr:single-stranded-DNA-specific exonuclease RecJ [Desulfotomaculum sp.]
MENLMIANQEANTLKGIHNDEVTVWRVKQTIPALNIILANQLNISELLAQMLINRGIYTVAEARLFLSSNLADLHDPLLMKDMAKALAAVTACLRDSKPVLIYGDYDVDGISGTALLVNALHRLGGVVNYYIPKRDQGYGLHSEVLRQAVADGYKLVITVDCGITAVAEAQLAKELGLMLVITDHHQPGPELPAALAVVNPKRTDCHYPYQDLAGVGVALKLVQAIYRSAGLPDNAWHDMLDLACLGTIADIVPLLGENRIIVKHGLKQLQNTSNLGLVALKAVCSVANRVIDSRDVGFALGPRLNAAGRMGDPQRGVELLLCPEPEQARKIAMDLDQSNRERQNIEQQVLDDAVLMLEQTQPELLKSKILVLASENWHFGVIGIVASRLLKRYHRPVLMIAIQDEQAKGSARSIDGFNLYTALEYCRNCLLKFGGHEKAAGFSVTVDNISTLHQKINEYADTVLDEEALIPSINLDQLVAWEQLTADVVTEMALLAPLGQNNPAPLLATQGVGILETRAVGKAQNHLKLKLKSEKITLGGIGFNLAAHIQTFNNPPVSGQLPTRDIIFTPEINEWNGTKSVQLKIKNICRQATIKSGCPLGVDTPHPSPSGQVTGGMSPSIQLASPDYILQKLEFYKKNGPVEDREHTGQNDRRHLLVNLFDQITLHDYRECPDRLEKLLNLIIRLPAGCKQEPVIILVNSGYQVLELVQSLALKRIELAKRIVYYSRGMPNETIVDISQLIKPDSGTILVTTPELISDLNIENIGKVIFYYPPFSMEGLQLTAEVTSAGGEWYFLFSTADIAASSKVLTTLAPERDSFVALYRFLIQHTGNEQVVEFSAAALKKLLTEDGGALVEDYTLALSMRVFAELKLLKFGYRAGIYQVKMLPKPSGKLNLENSKTFYWTNDIALEGLQFISNMVSGNLKQIFKLIDAEGKEVKR